MSSNCNKRGKGSKTIKPVFRKNTANEREKLFNTQTHFIREIQALERGKPIAIAKAKTEMERIKINKEYNKSILTKRKEISVLNDKLSKLY